MKTLAAFALGLGLIGFVGLPTRADDKKDEKDDKDGVKLSGKYTLVGGKKNDKAIDEDAKKGEYDFGPDKITIKGNGVTFVMGYKLVSKTNPADIDMEILDGPEGTKGSKAAGIVEVKGDTIKLAYSMDKDKDDKLKRPKTFDGKEGFMFEFKKAK
jgi:uncharacterized protein (TIGR03067 family)